MQPEPKPVVITPNTPILFDQLVVAVAERVLERLGRQATLRRAETECMHAVRRVFDLSADVTEAGRVIEAVGQVSGALPGDIVGRRRHNHIATVRHVAMTLCRDRLPGLSFPQLGRLFNRDHTSVMYATGKVAEALASPEPSLAKDIYLAAQELLAGSATPTEEAP